MVESAVNLLTLDSEQLGIPDTEYSSICTLSSSEFSRICREMSQIAETSRIYLRSSFHYFELLFLVNIETSKQSLKFSVAGEIGGGSISLRANAREKKDEQTFLQIEEPVSLSFALRYLNLFNKAQSLSPQVVLYMASGVPLVVEYKTDKIGSLKFYLAPTINDEDM